MQLETTYFAPQRRHPANWMKRAVFLILAYFVHYMKILTKLEVYSVLRCRHKKKQAIARENIQKI